jgi:DUF4097 and DUF4098 domain-containing protein YvlB
MKEPIIALLGVFIFFAPVFADYSESRNLSISAEDIKRLEIDCGAGFLKVTGIEGLREIKVEAEIIIDGINKKRAKDYIRNNARLDLKAKGSRAILESYFNDSDSFLSNLFSSKSARIDLTVRIPKTMAVDIEDGSGLIQTCDIDNDITIDDGSGDVSAENIRGNLDMNDGSGGIELEYIVGDVDIDDASGEIDAFDVDGDLAIEDGSGSIRVKDVSGNVRIEDGSGDITIRNVSGGIIVDDGSGDIRINYVGKDVRIIDDGSGDCDISHVDGEVIR